MAKIELSSAPRRSGCPYPAPYAAACMAREKRRLGDAAGLTQFGVNLMRLAPGAWSSQRHWHSHEDEFVYVLEGEVVLVDDAGETLLKAGDCAGFKAGVADGHHLQNRSQAEAVLLEVGGRDGADVTSYAEADMHWPAGAARPTHRDGTPYDFS